MTTSNIWEKFYQKNKNFKPFIPESFCARIFLSQRPIKLLDNYKFQKKSILDIGCGDGRHIDFLHKLGFYITGTEVAESKVKELKETFNYADFFVGTSSQLPFKTSTFDFVIAVNSIYYLDATDTLKKNIISCVNVLKTGGVFIASYVGNKHFIFLENSQKSTRKELDYKLHQCDDGISMQSVSSKKEIKKLYENTGINISKIGETHDEIDGLDRHLFYVIGVKK